MKNLKLMLVALFAVLGTGSVLAATDKPTVGDTWNDDNYYYKVIGAVNETAKTANIAITKANGAKSGELTIAPSITKNYEGTPWTLNITEISNTAFKDNVALTKVTFPATLETIDYDAFNGCTRLAEITFPSGSKLKKVGDRAFATTQIVNPDFTNCTILPSLPDLLFTDGTHENSYVETIKLPTTSVFKTFGTALAKLPNLKETNIASTKITIVEALAFNGTGINAVSSTDPTIRLKALELPGTVVTVEASAFQGSKIEDLTINADAISDVATTALGNNADPIYGTSTTVLKKLVLKGSLRGKISTNAFKGNTALASVDMEHMTFASKGQIMTSAFEGCTALTTVKVGNIDHNGNTGQYTINDEAFKGCSKLATVQIGNIDTKGAIGAKAFGEKLATLTIGNVTKALAVKEGAFVFDDANTAISIGYVSNENASGTDVVFPVGTFVLKATGTKTVNVTIGTGKEGKAIDSKGKVFAAKAFDASASFISKMTFDGAIIQNGIDVQGIVNGTLKELEFTGAIAEGGIAANAFKEQAGLATITFKGLLAPAAVGAEAFANTIAQTVNYSYNGTIENTSDFTGMPFVQTTFYATFCNDFTTPNRNVTLNITNTDMKAFVKAHQNNMGTVWPAGDIFYRVKLIEDEPVKLEFDVYQVGSTNVAYGRFALDKTKIYKIARRPKDANITYTLYTTYIEEDTYESAPANGITTLNMLPMLSTDGFYYINPSALGLTRDLVVIAKATGSGVTSDLKLAYEELSVFPVGAVNAPLYTDERVKVATQVVTNQQLRDRSGNSGVEALDAAALDGFDLYAITNPAGHEGISAPVLKYAESSIPFINTGMFYALGKHYAEAKASRMVINWIGEDEATGIVSLKNKNAIENDVIYTLQGVRVNTPVKGNIYIKNGKKFLAK